MAETICVSSPTLTSTQVSTSHSSVTTTRSLVTTLPGSTTTSVFTTCATSPNTTTCLTSTSLITRPGVVSTQIVTLTNVVDVPITALATLYGSSCRTVSNPVPADTTTSTYSTTTTTLPVITTTSYSTSTGTSLVTSDGTTFTSYYTSVSSSIPVSPSSDGTLYTTSTTSTLPALTPDPFQTNPASTPTPSGNNTAAIVGGTLGGLAALGLLALLTWHMIKKSNRFDNIFNKEDTNYYGPPPKDPPVNPYQYGLVGQQDTQPIGFSPPGSPGVQHANLVNEMGNLTNTAGNDPGGLHTGSSAPLGVGSSGNAVGMQGPSGTDAYNVPNQAHVHHVRNPSAVPLLVGIAGAAVVPGHTRPNTSSSRASVGSEVGPLVTHAAPSQNMGYPPQPFTSYPPALAAYAQQQVVAQPQVQAQQNLGHNTSVASSTTFSTLTTGSSSGSNNFVPVGAGSMMRRPTNISQQSQLMQSQRYDDPFARSGSPVMYQDRQVLQVRNAEPSMFVEGSSSRTPGLSVSGSSTPALDGKGRPLNVGGEKAPLVHLDGGAYAERARTPAPPAYWE